MADEEHDEPGPEEARENVNEQVVAEPAADDTADGVAVAITEAFDGVVAHSSLGQPVVHVPRELRREVAVWLRDEQQFEACMDVCAVDHLLNARRPVPAGVTPERFEVVSMFLSRRGGRRIRMICQVPADDPVVPSITPVYPGVDWGERETYDLFGIEFDGHPDLTRILMPEDWTGWPLRKDDAPARVPVQFKGSSVTPDQQARDRLEAATGGEGGGEA